MCFYGLQDAQEDGRTLPQSDPHLPLAARSAQRRNTPGGSARSAQGLQAIERAELEQQWKI
jgi:hypothetical protein